MDYLKKVLGIQTKYKESRFEGLPNFIYHIYHLHMADNPSFLSHQKKRQIRFPLSKKGSYPYPVVLLLSEITYLLLPFFNNSISCNFRPNSSSFAINSKSLSIPLIACKTAA